MSTKMEVLEKWVNSPGGPLLLASQDHHEQELTAAPHRHARGQLFGSFSGLLSVGMDDGVWVVPAIHAVWLPPHQAHSGRSHGPFHGWSVYVAEAACASLPQRPCTIRTSGLLKEAALRACDWPSDAAQDSLTPAQTHLASVILEEIRTLPLEPFGLPLPTDPRLARVARALIADPADDRDLEAWADWAAVSSRTLSRRFVAETGFSFTAWRQRARLMRSLEMLAAGLPVSTIALDLGWATASNFIGLFKRMFGSTPAVYRETLNAPARGRTIAPQ